MNSFLRFLTFFLLASVASAAFMPAHTSSRQTTTTTIWGAAAAAPATIERDAVFSGGPSILERPVVAEPPAKTTKEPTRDRRQQGDEAWEVRIYNDGLNTREHVARSLVQVTGLTEMLAYQTMMHAHQNGIAVVGRWVFEVAEMYHDELKKNGIVCDLVPVDED